MLKLNRYFLLFLFVGTFISSKATHNRAGEIIYRWLSGFTYEITLTVYTADGPSIADRCQDTIYFGDGTSSVVSRSNGPLGGGDCGPSSPLGEIITANFKRNIYITTHTYSNYGIYTIYMFDRNRNAGVINVPNSVNQPFYLESTLVISSLWMPNSSSVLKMIPIDKAVFGKCFLHNPAAYDPDGDSLSFDITPCKGKDAVGNIGGVIPGYTYPNGLGGGTFNINPLNGTLNWCTPQLNGEYNIAILIKEWRKTCGGSYVMIGSVLRDMQVIVGSATNSQPQMANVSDTCIQAGSLLLTSFTSTDPDAGDLLSISASGAPFACLTPTATFISTPLSSSPATGNFSWQTSFDHIRKNPYQATFKTIDDNAQISLADFKTYNIKVISPPPANLTAVASLNIVKLLWSKPTGYSNSIPNKIDHYDIYRKNSAASWTHSSCETGVPAYTGFSYIGWTNTVNDTSIVDYGAIGLINGTMCSYMVVAVYKDCSQSYASNIASDVLIIGIEELSSQNCTLKLYPNPAHDKFNIQINIQQPEFLSVKIYDLQGREINTLLNDWVKNKSNIYEFDLSLIASGSYLIKISGNNGTFLTKPIIKL